MSVTFRAPDGTLVRLPGFLEELAAAGYDPSQPRDPGGEGGGQWVTTAMSEEDYRGFHEAPGKTSGSPLHDIANAEEGVFPEDVYGPHGAQYYRHFPEFDEESLAVIRAARGKPDMPVTVYRAVPEDVNEINPGDWVTPSRSYAETHAASNLTPDGWKVIERTVPASELYSEGNSIHEFGWDPPAVSRLQALQAKHQAAGTEVWVSESPVGITLSQIKVPASRRGQGHARAALKDVLDYADETGQVVALTVGHDPLDKGLSKTQKILWYKRHGFVPNKGANKDFGFTETMVRRPKPPMRAAGYSPTQPRDPGGEGGGQWVKTGGTAGLTRDETVVEEKIRAYTEDLYRTLAVSHPEEYPYVQAEVDKQTEYLMQNYREAYEPAFAALEQRLAGIPDVRLVPRLEDYKIEQLAEGGTNTGDIMVKFGSGDFAPDFGVWYLPPLEGEEFPANAIPVAGGGALELHDVLDISDTDFFPPDEPDLAGRYADALDDVRGIKREGDITLFRGMSAAEAAAWERGEEIPTGKFFTSDRTANLAQDIAGEPPELYSWKVARRDVVETDPGVFQLRRPATLVDGRISDPAFEAEHPRGEEGEFIEKLNQEPDLPAKMPVGWPKGIYDPHDSVKFWPEKMGTDPGSPGKAQPLWKAFVDPDGNEVAFWFADQGGFPHHDDMLELWEQTGGPTNMSEFYGSSIAGYGDEVDLYEWRTSEVAEKAAQDAERIHELAVAEDWHTINDQYGYIGADIDGLTRDEIQEMLNEEYLDRFRAVPRRHRRDIKDARAMLEEGGLRASAEGAWTLREFNRLVQEEREALERFEPTLALAYSKIIRRMGRQIAARFEELAHPLAAAGYNPSQPRDPGGAGGGQWVDTGGAAEDRLLPADDEYTGLVKGARMRVHDDDGVHARMRGLEGTLVSADKDSLGIWFPKIPGVEGGMTVGVRRENVDMVAHPGSPADPDTETAMAVWRGSFASSSSMRAILEGREPAPAYRDARTRELTQALDTALEQAGPMGVPTYRIVPSSPASVGQTLDIDAGSVGVQREMVEPYRDTFVFGADEPTMLLLPPEARGVFYPDGQEAIVRDQFVVEEVVWNPAKKMHEVKLRVKDAVTAAGVYREEEHPRDPGGEGGGRWIRKGQFEAGPTPPVDIRRDLADHFKKKGVYDGYATADRIMPYGKEYMISKLTPRRTSVKYGMVTYFRADVDLLFPGSRPNLLTGQDEPSAKGLMPAELVYTAKIPKKAGAPIKTKTTITRKPPGGVTAAAGDPWIPPTVEELVAQITSDITTILIGPSQIRRRIFEKVVDAILRRLGLSFEVRSIISQGILNGLAARSEAILEGIRTPVARIIANSYLNGLSVPQTADALVEGIDGLAGWQATQLARNDLIGMANGGSLLAAKIVSETHPGIAGGYKQWLATPDERTRPTHNEAHGQRVPLETPFVVGGAPLDYPGDPSGPDGEVINCRCTLIYFSEPKAVAGAAAREYHRWPKGTKEEGKKGGGRFAPVDAPEVSAIVPPAPNEISPDLDENSEPDPNWMTPNVLQNMEALRGHAPRVKSEVVARLSRRLEDNPDWKPSKLVDWEPLMREYQEHELTGTYSDSELAVDALVQTWTVSSSDSNAASLLMQRTVAEEFGTSFAIADAVDYDMAGVESAPAAAVDSVREFIRAQYDETQEYLAANERPEFVRASEARGELEPHYTLYRGMNFMDEYDNPFMGGMSQTDYDMNPMSSWALSYDQAYSFTGTDVGGDHESGAILAARVPRSRVLSTALTGVGCLGETEVVLIGAGHGSKDRAWVFAGASNDLPYDFEDFRSYADQYANPKKKRKQNAASRAAHQKAVAAAQKAKQKEIAEALGEDPEDME